MGRALVLLPGLDGTGRLFGPFVAELPSWIEAVVLDYPAEPLGYADLADRLAARLPVDRPFFLLGESFGGPLALRLAARTPSGLRGVILVSTFLRYPTLLPRPVARQLAALLSRAPRPDFVVRRILLGSDAPQALVDTFRSIRASVAPGAIAHRVREVIDVDARRDLTNCPVPILCLSPTADRLVPRRAASEIRSIRPDATCVDLPGPHVLLARHPAQAASAIAAWIAAQGHGPSEPR